MLRMNNCHLEYFTLDHILRQQKCFTDETVQNVSRETYEKKMLTASSTFSGFSN